MNLYSFILHIFLFLSIFQSTIARDQCIERGEQCHYHTSSTCCGNVKCIGYDVGAPYTYCGCIKDNGPCDVGRNIPCCTPGIKCEYPEPGAYNGICDPKKKPCRKTGESCDGPHDKCCGSTKCVGRKGKGQFCGCLPLGSDCRNTFDCCDFGTKGIVCKDGECEKK